MSDGSNVAKNRVYLQHVTVVKPTIAVTKKTVFKPITKKPNSLRKLNSRAKQLENEVAITKEGKKEKIACLNCERAEKLYTELLVEKNALIDENKNYNRVLQRIRQTLDGIDKKDTVKQKLLDVLQEDIIEV